MDNNKYKNSKVQGFRSKLEQYCWEHLNSENISFSYEPFQIVLVDGFIYQPESYEKIGKGKESFKSQRNKIQPIKYTPDFVSNSVVEKVTWVIETKGYFNPLSRLKWKLFKRWLEQEGYTWHLFLPTNRQEVKQSIDLIKYNKNDNE